VVGNGKSLPGRPPEITLDLSLRVPRGRDDLRPCTGVNLSSHLKLDSDLLAAYAGEAEGIWRYHNETWIFYQ
jgi:hypothetical protein